MVDNRVSNDELLTRSRQRPVEIEMREHKWRRIGHTLRKFATGIRLSDSHSRGRAKGSWRRSLYDEFTTANNSLAGSQIKSNKPGIDSNVIYLFRNNWHASKIIIIVRSYRGGKGRALLVKHKIVNLSY